jgi:hypothetical protein
MGGCRVQEIDIAVLKKYHFELVKWVRQDQQVPAQGNPCNGENKMPTVDELAQGMRSKTTAYLKDILGNSKDWTKEAQAAAHIELERREREDHAHPEIARRNVDSKSNNELRQMLENPTDWTKGILVLARTELERRSQIAKANAQLARSMESKSNAELGNIITDPSIRTEDELRAAHNEIDRRGHIDASMIKRRVRPDEQKYSVTFSETDFHIQESSEGIYEDLRSPNGDQTCRRRECGRSTRNGNYYLTFKEEMTRTYLGNRRYRIEYKWHSPRALFICNRCIAAAILKPEISSIWGWKEVAVCFFLAATLPVAGLLGMFLSPSGSRLVISCAALLLIVLLSVNWGKYLAKKKKAKKALLQAIENDEKSAADAFFTERKDKIIDVGDRLACKIIEKTEHQPENQNASFRFITRKEYIAETKNLK